MSFNYRNRDASVVSDLSSLVVSCLYAREHIRILLTSVCLPTSHWPPSFCFLPRVCGKFNVLLVLTSFKKCIITASAVLTFQAHYTMFGDIKIFRKDEGTCSSAILSAVGSTTVC
jgi:hypothetical protein